MVSGPRKSMCDAFIQFVSLEAHRKVSGFDFWMKTKTETRLMLSLSQVCVVGSQGTGEVGMAGTHALGFGVSVLGSEFLRKGSSFRGTGFWCLGSGHRASRMKGLWLRWV